MHECSNSAGERYSLSWIEIEGRKNSPCCRRCGSSPPFSPAARETPLTPLSALNEAMMASQLGAVDSGYPRLTVGGRSDGLHVGNRICTGGKEFKAPENVLKFRQFVKHRKLVHPGH